MNKIELLSPAGNLEKLKIAVMYGADAVFIGGKKFSLRARASNFDLEDIKEACEFASKYGSKVYVTMNIIPQEEDYEGLVEYLQYLESVGVSAIIASSMHIIKTALEVTKMEVHLSTQLSITNSEACKYYEKLGIHRIVLGREVSLKQMEDLRKNVKADLEVFIHGGMCSSYSGRCMLSNHFVNRDANRGGCAHSCRWNYNLYKDDEAINEDGFFNFGSRDLCALKAIPDMIRMGINSLKIEGRMKSEYYIATVVRTYRRLIDDYYAGKVIDFDYYAEELKKAENRLASTGFLYGDVTIKEQLYERDEHPTKEFVGIVLGYENGIAKIEQRNYFEVGDEIEFFGPNKESRVVKVLSIKDENGNLIEAARHPKMIIYLDVPFAVEEKDMLRLVLKKGN